MEGGTKVEKILKLLSDLGAKGGIGLLLTLVGIGLMVSDKIDVAQLADSVKNLPANAMIAVICAILGLALLSNQIHDLKKNSEKSETDQEELRKKGIAASEQSALFETQIYDLKRRNEEFEAQQKTILQKETEGSEQDRRVLADLMSQFASHRVLYIPLEYENIGEAVNSVQILRRVTTELTRGSSLGLPRRLSERAGFYLQNFITAIDDLENRVASTADAYISSFNEGREFELQARTRMLYQKLKRPIFSTKNQLVATGEAGISLEELSCDFALAFVRAFYEMRGGFQEVVYQAQAAGVTLPQQLQYSLASRRRYY